MNQFKILQGQAEPSALREPGLSKFPELVPNLYKSFPYDSLGQAEMENLNNSEQNQFCIIWCRESDLGASNPPHNIQIFVLDDE